MKLKSFLSTLLLTTSLISSVAFAEEPKKEEPKPVPFQQAGYNFIGASLGIAKPVGATLSTPLRFNFGAEFSHAFGKEFAVGAFASRNNGSVSHSSDVNFGMTRVGVEAIYSPIKDGYIDLRTGIAFLDSTSKTYANSVVRNSTDAKPLFWGPGFGWIFPVCDKIQVIPNLHYSHFLATSGAESFNVFDVMMTLRYTL